MTKRRLVQAPRMLLPVVADGALAYGGAAGGRLVPVAMIDTRKQPLVSELLRVHTFFESGDCKSIWGKALKDETMFLRLNFVRPSKLLFALTFDLSRQAGLVDQIIRCEGFYLQHGVTGDTMSKTLKYPRILIEVPSGEVLDRWEKIFPELVSANFRKSGIPRNDAARAADEIVERWRNFGSFRMK